MGWPEKTIENWTHLASVLEGTGGVYLYPSLWSFRGQSDKDWPLRPTIARRFSANRTRDLQLCHELEQHLIGEFIQRYPSLDIGNHFDYKRFNTLRWLTMMQHYGVPTRLLDWSNSPFVAAFFACETNHDKDGAIWMFSSTSYLIELARRFSAILQDTDESKYLWESPNPLVHHLTTRFKSSRCLSQQGEFTISSVIFGNHEHFIHEVLDGVASDGKQLICKLIIPAQLKIDFLARLISMGVSADTLFPGGDGFGRFLGTVLDVRSKTEEKFRAAGVPRRSDSSEVAKRTHEPEPPGAPKAT